MLLAPKNTRAVIILTGLNVNHTPAVPGNNTRTYLVLHQQRGEGAPATPGVGS